jgi:hypothetical protein
MLALLYLRAALLPIVWSSEVLEELKRIWSIASEISNVHSTEVKIATIVDFLRNNRGHLAVKLAQHASETRERLFKRRQKLEKAWKDEVSTFVNELVRGGARHDLNNIVRELKNIEKEMRYVKGALAAVSKICSVLGSIPAEKRSPALFTLLVYYEGIKASLLKRSEALEAQRNSLYKLYEYAVIFP